MTDTTKTKKDPTTFATGAGGGSNGDKAKNYEHKIKPKNAKSLAKNAARITSKSTTATIALPDMPVSTSSSMLNALTSGGASKGFGGGSGGGIGSGIGAGVGGGKNFLGGLKVMGAKIMANRIAVYMDASESLRSYLDRVRGEITKQFPDADIFMYGGTKILVNNGKIVGMEKSQLKQLKPKIASYQKTSEASLTANGKDIFKKYNELFEKCGLGAFIEVMRTDTRLSRNYGAIIVFSDFNDGVVQTREIDGEPVYADGLGYPEAPDYRNSDEKRWESDWKNHFKKGATGAGPKLYLFSTDSKPSPILIDCVKSSKGRFVNVKWLKDNGNPPENAEDEEY